jgi:polyketide biosynthesis enoyl-CoA hydratase PksH
LPGGQLVEHDPQPLYELWLKLATGPYVTISHVRGKANAGGVGFAAASDIVLADQTAQFSLSELLFGLFPACVLPFLTRRVGFQKAHYMTLMTWPVPVPQAHDWGLVDAYDEQSETLVRKHLLRLKCLCKKGISRYKRYMSELNQSLLQIKPAALAANREVFSDPDNLQGIYRYVENGQFPWET